VSSIGTLLTRLVNASAPTTPITPTQFQLHYARDLGELMIPLLTQEGAREVHVMFIETFIETS